MRIISEYSLWFVILCVALGIATAWWLYHKDSKLSDAPLFVKKLLFALRAVIVSFVLFLVLGPFMEWRKSDVQKPVIAVLQDNSASIVLNKDSVFYKSEYVKRLRAFVDRLKGDYTVDVYGFGGEMYPDSVITFGDKQTNISNLFGEINSRYANRNIGAVVLATDGIYNAGENPKYGIQNMAVAAPVYCVAMGDSVQAKDNVITDVLHNEVAFKGNPFTVKIAVESHALRGKLSKLAVYDAGKKVFETTVAGSSNDVYKTVDCKLVCNETGQRVFKVVIERQDGEISLKNNEFSFFVDVLESRQHILLLYDGVHPDVGVIKRALDGNKNFEVSMMQAAVFKGNFGDYTCVILHGMPEAFGKTKELTQRALESGVPLLFVYNSTMHVPLFPTIGVGMEILNRNAEGDEAVAVVNKDFDLFETDDETRAFLESVPPLLAPFGNYTTQVQAKVFCRQGVNGTETERPLILFSQWQGTKIGFVCGEGLWRWRMYDFKRNATFAHFDGVVNKMVSYLALTQKRELFTVRTRGVVSDNEDVEFTAGLYNKSYEPVANREISLVIRDGRGRDFPFVFSPDDEYYKLNAGKFPAGKYLYKASVAMDGTTLVKQGAFFVIPLQTEFQETQANHGLLRSIAEQSKGAVFFPDEFDLLYSAIRANKDIVPVSHVTESRDMLIDMPLLLILLLLLAGTEWFLRKYYASY